MEIPENLPPELIVLAFALVLLSKLLDKLIDKITPYLSRKLNGSKPRQHNGRELVNLKELQVQIKQIDDWHKVQGAGLIRIMNATENYIKQSTVLLRQIATRCEDNHADLQKLKDKIT